MEITQLIEDIKKDLALILDLSGSVVFSSIETVQKGDLYTMGLNPGGNCPDTVRHTLDVFPAKRENAYLDEDWGNGTNPDYRKGLHPLQQNFVKLIAGLGFDVASVFSTNLIFTRSQGQYGADYPRNADICWKVHQRFIEIVDPEIFLVFGNSKISPFQYLRTNYKLGEIAHHPSGHGTWQCVIYKGEIEGRDRLVVGVPHLSRYYIKYHPDVISWIRANLV